MKLKQAFLSMRSVLDQLPPTSEGSNKLYEKINRDIIKINIPKLTTSQKWSFIFDVLVFIGFENINDDDIIDTLNTETLPEPNREVNNI